MASAHHLLGRRAMMLGTKLYRRYDDGYIVRRMLPEDAEVVIGWFLKTMTNYFPRDDIQLCLEQLSPEDHGFYVGELNGNTVASLVRLHWGHGYYHGSKFYVEEQHRGQGYGKRLHEVALGHVGSCMLAIDAVQHGVPGNCKHGYIIAETFTTSDWQGTVKKESVVPGKGLDDASIVEARAIPFRAVMSYDDKHFITPGSSIRHHFMRELIRISDGKSLVAMDTEGCVIGFGCRRPCVPSGGHLVGPLYADSPDVALSLFKALCREIVGEEIIVTVWNRNEDALRIVKHFSMEKSSDFQRMHLNGNPQEFKATVFAVTSEVCGF